MTMHLVRGMTSLNTKKSRNKTNRKPGWEKAQAEHDKWLIDRGVHPTQLKNKPKAHLKAPEPYLRESPKIPSLDSMRGDTFVRNPNKYTGTLIKGIATMHKSNAVPIIDRDQAIEVSNMRRG
tara:strand:- start:74 stop:439 length:366 start_codon:yes stop_codon:yes gene_type:complete